MRRGRFWTTEEDEMIRADYPTHTAAQMADRLDRSELAIIGRASFLRVRRASEWRIAQAKVINAKIRHERELCLQAEGREGRFCVKCRRIKPLADFSEDARMIGGKRRQCRQCRHTLPNGASRYQAHALRKRYGLSVAEYDALRTRQSGKCAICGNHEMSPRPWSYKDVRSLCVDHDHETGRVRGLLCTACNKGVGIFREKPLTLLAAANYLLNAHVNNQ